jgi:hypothetical protein
MGGISAQLVETVQPDRPDSSATETIAATIAVREKDATDRLTSHLLLFAFLAAVLLAIAGFVFVAAYLFRYLDSSLQAFNQNAVTQLSSMKLAPMQDILLARAGLWKFILQSCGVVSGAAFGFLGFALFLLGVKGDMDAAFADGKHNVQLTRMAPGSFVILIAAVLIGLCSIHRVDLSFTPVTQTTEQAGPATGQAVTNAPAPSPVSNSNDPALNPNASLFGDSARDEGTATGAKPGQIKAGAAKQGSKR